MPRPPLRTVFVVDDGWAHYEFSFKDAEYAEWLGGEAAEFDLPEPLKSRGLVGMWNPQVPVTVDVSYYAKRLALPELRGRALIIRPGVGLNGEDERIAAGFLDGR
jgi:hypothetical protein